MVSSLSPWRTGVTQALHLEAPGEELAGKSSMHLVSGPEPMEIGTLLMAVLHGLDVGLTVRLCHPGRAPITVGPQSLTDFPQHLFPGAGSSPGGMGQVEKLPGGATHSRVGSYLLTGRRVP